MRRPIAPRRRIFDFRRASTVLAGILVWVVATGSSCSSIPDEPQPIPVEAAPPEPVYEQANVDSIRVLKLESFPVEAFVYVTGYLPDRATKIAKHESQRVGNQFEIQLLTERPANSIATTELDPFEYRIPLEISSLPPGTYTVVVNGVSDSFDLSRHNVRRGD